MVFHIERRERVLERDIFRFGTGTVIVLNLFKTIRVYLDSMVSFDVGKYPLFIRFLKIQPSQPRPTGVNRLMGMLLG